MEELLNKLIEKGWKPFYEEIKSKWGVRGNYPCKGAIKIRKNTIFISYRYESSNEQTVKWKKLQHSIRELVSKESGLWQFCVENNLVKDLNQRYTENDLFNYYQDNYHYWLIKSALCNEEDLEKFLLENIKSDF